MTVSAALFQVAKNQKKELNDSEERNNWMKNDTITLIK